MFVLGDFTTADTLYLPFDTYDSNGASVTITGLAVTDVEIYKDGSVTQRVSDNGIALLDTDGIDFDGAVGLHGFSVDLSDNSDADFYVAGSTYWINVNAITVDSQTVRFTYHFTIGKLLRPTTAGRTLGVDANGRGDVGSWLGTAVPAPTVAGTPRVEVVSALAAFFQDCFTVDSGEVSGAEVSGSLILEIAKVIWDRVLSGSTHNISTSAGRRLRQVEAAAVHASGTIAVVTDGHTFTLDGGAVATANYYIGDRLGITEGVGAGQSRLITGYTSGKICTLDSDFAVNPNTSSLYDVVAADVHVSLSDADLAGGFVAVYTNLTTITLDAGAVATSNYYKDAKIIFTHGTGQGQSAQITAYTSGRVCTLSPALIVALDTTTSWHITANAGTENLGGMSTGMKAEVQAEVDAALATYDGPTNAEMEARTILAAAYFDPTADAVANVTLVGTLTTYTGNTLQTGDVTTAINDLANATDGLTALKAVIDIIATDTTTDIPALIATAQADLDTITGTGGVLIGTDVMDRSGTLDVNTKTLTAGAITATIIAAAAIDNATFAADVGSTAYATNIIALAVRKALDEIHIDHLLAVDYDPASKPGVATALLNELIESNAGVSRYTAASLAQAPSGSGGDATAANQTLIITHLTDVKGTAFVKDTDSLIDLAHTGADGDTLKGLSDQIDTLSALSGGGAFTGTLTINDGATALQGVVVNARLGGVLQATGTTDVNGQITNWAFDANTYDLASQISGYQPSTDTLTVSADAWTKTISLTIIAISAPPNASTTTGVMTVYDEEGSVESGVTVTVQILAGPGTDGIAYDSTEWAETSSALGVVEFAGIILGARYKIWRGTAKAAAETFTAPTTGDSFDLAEVIGRG